MIKKVLRQERDFSTRLNCANKKVRDNWMNMFNGTYNSTEHMINKLQELKGKTKLKYFKNLSNYYDNMIIIMDDDLFAKNAQSKSKIHHEVLLLMKFLQIKPQVKYMNTNYYDLYYTVFKNRDEKAIEDNQFGNDFINFTDILPNHNISVKPHDTILR